MKLRLKRCRICLWWYSPVAHSHCPSCGAFDFSGKHYAVSLAGEKVRELVSAVHIPLALRHLYIH